MIIKIKEKMILVMGDLDLFVKMTLKDHITGVRFYKAYMKSYI